MKARISNHRKEQLKLRILFGRRLNPIVNGSILHRPIHRLLHCPFALRLRLLPATPESAKRARDEAADEPIGERLQQ